MKHKDKPLIDCTEENRMSEHEWREAVLIKLDDMEKCLMAILEKENG